MKTDQFALVEIALGLTLGSVECECLGLAGGQLTREIDREVDASRNGFILSKGAGPDCKPPSMPKLPVVAKGGASFEDRISATA